MKNSRSPLGMRLRQLFRCLLFVLLLWPIGHLAYTVIDGLADNGQKADVAVILGSKVNPDGTLSTRLERRVDCGLKLYLNKRVKKVIVSGGLGKEGFLEGSKMKAFLVHHGVPDSAVVVDNHGDNTLATVNNVLRLQDSLHYRRLIIVSQYFHLTRTKMLFRKHQFYNISGVSPNYFEARDIYSLLREFIAYYTE